MNLNSRNFCKAFEGRMFLGVSNVVATPIIKMIGILIAHSLIKQERKNHRDISYNK